MLCPRCAFRFHFVIDVHHSDFVMVDVAVGPDGVLITILGLVVLANLSRGGSSGRLFVVGLSIAPGMLLVDN